MVALFLGSFNPVHAAHKAAVMWALDNGFEDVWVVVSPQNPMKNQFDLAPLEHRVAMVKIAMQGLKGVQVMDFEKDLPCPHYTIDAIEYLQREWPTKKFAILCGSDIVEQLPHWHREQELRGMVDFVEYDRTILDVSSTEIRSGEKVDLVDRKVRQYIVDNNLYVNHLDKAKELFAAEMFGDAINELDLCDSIEATSFKEMIYNILAFRNTDIYNP